MIYYNKVLVLGSGCHLKLTVLLFFHSVNLMKMDVCGKLPYTAIYVVWKKLLLSMMETTNFTKEFVSVYYLWCKQKKSSTVSVPWWHPKLCRLLRPSDFSRSNQTEGNHSSSSSAEPSCLLWHWYHILKKQIFLACGQVVRIPYRAHFWLSRLKLFLSQG